jgi:hypothetical protein
MNAHKWLEVEDVCFLKFYAAFSSNCWTIPFLGSLHLKMKAIKFFETYVTLHQFTKRNMAKYLNYQQNHCDKLEL